MVDLTEEEKIVIGVCSAIAALVIIGIIIFICCILYRKQRKYRRRGRKSGYHKERYINGDHYYDNRQFNGDIREIKKYPPPYDPIPLPEPIPVPMPLPLPPPPPPEPRTRWELYEGNREYIKEPPREYIKEYREPIREPIKEPVYISAVKTYGRPNYGGYGDRVKHPLAQKSYIPEARRDYTTNYPPVVIPMREPEYITSPPVEQDTIYLKYRDDQALMYTDTAYRRAEAPVLRRTRSFTDIPPKRSKYVGEWGHPIFQPFEMNYNDRAARAGRDPFLWQH